MKSLKLQIFSGSTLLNEIEIEEEKVYTIGSGPNCTIPIFDEKFPQQLLSFQNIGDFINIQSKDKNVQFPPSLKIPSSFSYKGYRFLFKKVIPNIKKSSISAITPKSEKKTQLYTYSVIAGIVIFITTFAIVSYINKKHLEKEYVKDLGELSKLQDDRKIINLSSLLLKKYKDTKYEKLIRQKTDELLKIRNEYMSLLERLRYNAKYKTNYQELFRIIRMKKKILKKIEWEIYRKKAEKLLDKIRLKMIFIKHKALVNMINEMTEQIKNERFVQAYTYYHTVIVKNKLISPRYTQILKKKLDIGLEKDKARFEKELQGFVNSLRLDEAENLVKIKINTYPPEYTNYLKGFLKLIIQAREELQKSKEEKEIYKKEKRVHHHSIEKEIIQKQEEPPPPPPETQQPEPVIFTDDDIIQLVRQKKYEELKTIFENEKYKFNISPDGYTFAKIFIDLDKNCAEKKPFEYTINKAKKSILSCSTDIVRVKERNVTRNIKLKDMEFEEIYYILMQVEPNFENKVVALKFMEKLGLKNKLPLVLGYLYTIQPDKKEEIKNIVRNNIEGFKDKNPVWLTEGRWVVAEEMVCSNLSNITKKKESFKKILEYLSKLEEDKEINLANLGSCKLQLKDFLDYVISVLKNQYNAAIDSLFNQVNNEIDELRKEIVKVIRSQEYLKSVQKKGEQVEWNPNAPAQNKHQEFLDKNNKYIDTILVDPWQSKTAKEKFTDLDKLMVIYRFFEKSDNGSLLPEFLKQWDAFWKPKWEQLVEKRFALLKQVEATNDRIFANLKRSNQITDDEIECVKLVNKYRVKLGFNPLTFNKKLYDGAGIHAQYLEKLAERQKKSNQAISLSHFQQNTDTPTPADRAKKAGYKPVTLGENIAYSPNEEKNTPEWIVEGWRHSPYHHNGLITQGVFEIGCYKENFAWVLLLGSEK